MEVKHDFKKTEIGLIPNDWELMDIGEIFTFKNGLNKAKEYFGLGTPIVNYMDVFKKRGLTLKDIKGKVTVSNNELKTYNVKKGDVFFTRTSETVDEIGITSVILEDPHKTVFSGFILRARPYRKILDLDYCRYCFSSYETRKQITSKSSYTTRALTNGRLLSSVTIPIPTKNEQQGIAKCLSDLDDLITSLHNLIAKKRTIKQSAMQQLLTGNIRLTGYRDEWDTKHLSNIAWFQEGPGVRNYQFQNSGIKLINGTNILNGRIEVDTTNRYISEEEAFGRYRHFLVDEGDIIIASSGISLDNLQEKVGIASADILPLCMNTSTIRFKSYERLVNRDYLFYILQSSQYTHQVAKQATGSAQLNYGPYHLRRIFIDIPSSIDEQLAISSILSDIDLEISSLESHLVKTKDIKLGLMQELLTGKTRFI